MTGNSLIFRLLVAVIVLAPLPLGANRPWAWSLMAVAVALLCGAWAILVPFGAARAPVPFRRLWIVAVPFLLALAWAVVQTSGILPASVWHPLWEAAQTALGIPSAAQTGMISADPALTRAAALRLATYGAVFWLAVQLGSERVRAREALMAVAVAGALYAGYGLTVHFSGRQSILWLEKWAYLGDLTATFVNRNAYGAYAGVGVVCCLGLFMHALRPSSRRDGPRVYEMAETVLVRALPFLVAAVVLVSALLLSHSRGAFLSTAAAIPALMVALVAGRVTRPRTAMLMGGIMLAIGLVVLGVSGDVTVKRLAQETAQNTDEERTDVYRLTLRAIEDAPLTGTGLGAFQPTFNLYRDASLSRSVLWDYAHNVHLELVLDLGLPGAALLYLSFAVILGVCVRGLLVRRRDQVYPAVALAVAVLLGLHGLVDFSAQMPAIAATLALLLGIGYAQSWSTSEHRQGEPGGPTGAG